MVNKVSFENLELFLKNNYNEIYNSIKKENYKLEYVETEHIIFKELKYQDKVVGFALVDLIFTDRPKYSVCECFILPEYRGNNILFDFIISNITKTNYDFGFRRPNRAIINLLLKYNLAFSLNSKIVISYIDLDTSINEIYTNNNIKKLYKKDVKSNPIYSTYYYNWQLASVMFIDLNQIIAKNNYTLCLSTPRKSDLNKYNLRKKLKTVSESSLDNILLKIADSGTKINEFINDTYDDLKNFYSVDNIIGTTDNYTKAAKSLFETYNINDNEAKIILNKVNNYFNAGKIVNFTIPDYFNYLVKNYHNEHDNNLNIEDKDFLEENGFKYYIDDNLKIIICPECNHENSDYNKTCENCGYNIDLINKK